MLRVEFHTRIAHNHQALAGLVAGERRPLHVGALARFANFHVHDRHGIYESRVDAHEGAAVTAHVVLVGAATEVANLFVAARHRE